MNSNVRMATISLSIFLCVLVLVALVQAMYIAVVHSRQTYDS